MACLSCASSTHFQFCIVTHTIHIATKTFLQWVHVRASSQQQSNFPFYFLCFSFLFVHSTHWLWIVSMYAHRHRKAVNESNTTHATATYYKWRFDSLGYTYTDIQSFTIYTKFVGSYCCTAIVKAKESEL